MVIGSIYHYSNKQHLQALCYNVIHRIFSFILRCIKKYLGVMCVGILVISMCLTFSFPLRCLGGGVSE